MPVIFRIAEVLSLLLLRKLQLHSITAIRKLKCTNPLKKQPAVNALTKASVRKTLQMPPLFAAAVLQCRFGIRILCRKRLRTQPASRREETQLSRKVNEMTPSFLKLNSSFRTPFRTFFRFPRSCRPSSGTSTRFCAGTSRTAERSRAMSDNLPHMDYRQHRRARRLVHECCNYDEGNCLLLDDGEPCVCVQSISFSLMCHWFRVAVLPLDGELAAALLCRGSRKRCAVCGAAFVPKSNRGKYCPDCAGRMKKIKAAERKRKQRQRCHALEPFKPA